MSGLINAGALESYGELCARLGGAVYQYLHSEEAIQHWKNNTNAEGRLAYIGWKLWEKAEEYGGYWFGIKWDLVAFHAAPFIVQGADIEAIANQSFEYGLDNSIPIH